MPPSPDGTLQKVPLAGGIAPVLLGANILRPISLVVDAQAIYVAALDEPGVVAPAGHALRFPRGGGAPTALGAKVGRVMAIAADAQRVYLLDRDRIYAYPK